MEPEEKKKLVLNLLKKGDKRSYNEIVADLELELWAERHKGAPWFDIHHIQRIHNKNQ